MKLTKRLSTLLVAVVLMLAMTINVFAYDITITPKSPDDETHTYEAYQLFKGTLTEKDGKKILSNITWGDNVDQTKLATLAADINALRDSSAQGYVALTASSSPSAFADAIAELNATHDSAKAQSVADAFGKVLTGSPKGTGTGTSDVKVTVADAGYYLVKDQDGSLNGKEDAAYTRYILQVVSDVTVAAKSEVPTVDKKITGEGTTTLSANSASIGDEIPYEINSKVPDMTGYEKYYFVLNDTMSKGLTFNNDVKVTIDGTELAADAFTVTTGSGDSGETTIKIVLKNFIQYKDKKGKDIKITYTATLNEQADLTANGNVNEVILTYSNDPNYDYQGTDEPGPSEPTGVTPKSETKTFATSVELKKIDGADGKTLTGAKFSISGEKLNVTLINKQVFEKADDGTYYMLKDGTYTETAPAGNENLYDSTTQKYKLVEHVTKEVTKEQVNAEGYVKADGTLLFEGLNAGTYIITELVAPDGGYNLLTTPITLVITGTVDQTAKSCTWSATVDGENATISNNVIKFNVENKKGNELPSTGGMGTRIFYALGSILVIGAGVILVSRKRASNK